jgi:phosphohistidine phosphatase
LAKAGAKPDLILSSPATRALATAQIIARKLGYKRKNIVVDDRLYAVEVEVLLDVIRQLDDAAECAMLFGHNPELTELVHRLSSKIGHLPTCAVVELAFEGKLWKRIGVDKPSRVPVGYVMES